MTRRPTYPSLRSFVTISAILAILAFAAVTESLVRAIVTNAGLNFALAICLLAICTTVPLLLLGAGGAVAVICAACVLSVAAFHTLTVAGVVALLLAFYRFGSGGTTAPLLGLTLPFVVLTLVGTRPLGSEVALLTACLAVGAPAALLFGMVQHARRDARESLAERESIAGNLLEHTARGERARIARELHDVVAHHISIVAVQAETARLTTPGMPAAGAQRLSAIGDTARTALTEMRRLLGVLREDTELDLVDTRPQPGILQFNELLDETRDASGTCARFILQGSIVALDPGVELAAYRITQEALTNARRHARGAAIDVELRFEVDVLRLRIRDNGPGPSNTSVAGHGLVGMRERATAVGGQLRIGSAPGGGFLVEALLPITTKELE